MLKRSKRFGVGKEIGGAVYVHRLYERLRVIEASQSLPKDFDYVVVKFNIKDQRTSFIEDFDYELGDSIIVYPDNTQAHQKTRRSLIYHHKWLFVKDDL